MSSVSMTSDDMKNTDPGALLDPDRFEKYLAAAAPELAVQRVVAIDRFPSGLS